LYIVSRITHFMVGGLA